MSQTTREEKMSILASKKFLIVTGMILGLLISIAIGGIFKLNTTALLTDDPAVSVVKEAVPESKSGNGHNAANENEAGDNLIKVVRVIDGDTIEIAGGKTVRYVGVDTPETVDPRKPVQCFGVEASYKNKELVEGKMVRLEKDITERDKYSRLLRYVWVGDTFVNLALVERGFAYSYSYPPDIKYQDLFVKAQQEARDAKRGLWGSCPAVAPAQTETPAPQENTPGGSCLIKGNISSSGEKIYHLPSCDSYGKTKIDEARGEKWFCSESEALAAGWRKALNCQ